MCVCVCVCVCALFGSIAGQQARILPSVTVVKWLVALECHRVFFFSFSFFFFGVTTWAGLSKHTGDFSLFGRKGDGSRL